MTKKLSRDYSRVDRYLDILGADVYPQPPDEWHNEQAQRVIAAYGTIPVGTKTILDIGCGQGFCKPMWEEIGYEWSGVTLGQDYAECKKAGLSVERADMSFLPFEDASFDILFARHVLEHSPMPIVTLMEWHRVANPFIILVAPNPLYWGAGGRNHYSVATIDQILWWLELTNWDVMRDTKRNPEDHPEKEFWFLCRAKGEWERS